MKLKDIPNGFRAELYICKTHWENKLLICNSDINLIRVGQSKMNNVDDLMNWEVIKIISNKDAYGMVSSGNKEWDEPTEEQKQFFQQ